MKDNYFVTFTNNETKMEFNFESIIQARDFIYVAIMHGVNITVTIKRFAVPEEGEGLRSES